MATQITSNASDSVIQVNGQDALPINLGGSANKLASVTCTQNAGELTFTLNPCVEEFRSATLTTGVPNLRKINTALSLVLPSGGTLAFPTTIAGRIIVAVMDVDATTQELAITSLAGGLPLSEEGVITTVAIGTGSDSANVWYSTTQRTGVPYKIKGVVEVINTTGTWASPTLVQPAGGNALTAMSSLGYGQTWQVVTGSRAVGTTYYNTTARPIQLAVSYSTPSTSTIIVNGITLTLLVGNVAGMPIVPPGGSYSSGGAGTGLIWIELR